MKIAAWNVNSLKVRLPQFLDFLATREPDAVCLQETKLTDDNFPVTELAAAGYHVVFAGQKTYNGVAIVSRAEPVDVQIGIPGFEDELILWLKDELTRHPKLAVLGDYNIAPDDRDVHDPEIWKDGILVSEPERARFRALLELGLKDSFRLFDQPEKTFSWWDYRMMGFRRNHGLRIDHILLSPPLAAACTSSTIDRDMRKLERPSDHAPALAEISLST